MLCVHRMRLPPEPIANDSPSKPAPKFRGLRPKIGPLWKLIHVVEPAATPLDAFPLRNEKNELLILDGPFAETKEWFGGT